MISHAIIFGSDLKDIVEEDYVGWTIVIFKITGFMCAIIFIVLGCYIAYYRSVVKVDAIKSIEKMTLYCLVSFAVIGLTHSTFCIYFAIAEEITVDKVLHPDYNIEKKSMTASTLATCI